MAKDPAHMTHAERMAALARELHSPSSVVKADKMLDLIGHEWREIYGMRESAARRHGDASAAPSLPVPPSDNARTNERRPGGGTVASLVEIYRSDEKSPYHSLRYKTREHYEIMLKRIVDDCGNDRLSELRGHDVERLYKGWTNDGRTFSMGKAVVTMFRTVIYFGATELGDADCERLSVILHRMKFAVPKSRNEQLTAVQAAEICSLAKKMDRASVALAQAFQFDCDLRQKDVIGEWVPLKEPGESDIGDFEGNKWLRGIRWEQIDNNLILTHRTSKTQTEITVDLKQAPMVLAELKLKFGGLARSLMPESGPIIVSEVSSLPWRNTEFRRYWRKAADAAGVPRSVKNMDSRARTKARVKANMAA